MKTKNILLSILFCIISSALNAATYAINQNYTISVTTGYVNNMTETWNVTSTVTDKPLLINYSIGTETSFDFLTINNVDNSGNVTSQLIRISGTQIGTVSTIAPNGRVQIVFTSDGSNNYSTSSSLYPGINVTFAVNTNNIVDNTFQVTGNSYVNGKMGIGTMAPQAGLHVTQTGTYNGSTISALFGASAFQWTNFGSVTGGRIRGSAEGYLVVGSNPNGTGDKSLYLNFDSPGNIAMATGGGNVGIGTYTPSERLEIFDSNTTPGTLSLRSYNTGSDENVEIGRISAKQSTVEVARIGMPRVNGTNSGSFSFWTKARSADPLTEKVRIDGNGYVGIGTATPQSNIDIFKTATTNTNEIIARFIRADTPNGGSNIVRLGYQTTADIELNSGYNGSGFRYGSYNDFNLVNNKTGGANGGINFITNTANRLTISAGGNVGIGTTNPTCKFEVKGNYGAPGTSGTTQSNIARFTTPDNGVSLDMGVYTTDPYAFWLQATSPSNLAGSRNLILNPNGGKVGIGTTNPGAKLDVAGNIQLNSKIGMSLNDTLTYGQYKGLSNYSLDWKMDPWTTSGPTLWQSAWGGMKFFTNGIPRLSITNTGKVSIGTTVEDLTDGVLLTVKGTIHTKEVLVDLNAPLADYVFDESYQLMPLSQLKQYVKENNHLPEMPSATEVKDKGMNMGEMQNKLLQKVEELTLYSIQQQEEIQLLKSEIQQLKQK